MTLLDTILVVVLCDAIVLLVVAAIARRFKERMLVATSLSSAVGMREVLNRFMARIDLADLRGKMHPSAKDVADQILILCPNAEYVGRFVGARISSEKDHVLLHLRGPGGERSIRYDRSMLVQARDMVGCTFDLVTEPDGSRFWLVKVPS